MQDDDKVMDVAKPGKGKIVGTSRPVVAPLTSGTAKQESVDTVSDESVPEPALVAPSVAKKVIQPLSDTEKPVEEAEKTEADEASAEASVKPSDTITEPQTEPTRSADAPAEGSTDGSADAAEVNALADQMKSKKEEAAKAEEQAKKDAALQELIDSKTYVVPIGKTSKKSKTKTNPAAVLLLVLVLVLVGGYALLDAGVVDVNITLPFDLIK